MDRNAPPPPPPPAVNEGTSPLYYVQAILQVVAETIPDGHATIRSPKAQAGRKEEALFAQRSLQKGVAILNQYIKTLKSSLGVASLSKEV